MSGAITVRDVMTREFLGVSEGDGVTETVELLLDDGVGCAVVLRGPTPVGAVSERDALSAMVGDTDLATATVSDVMNDAVVRVAADASLAAAAKAMAREGVAWLLAVESEPVGVVSAHDLVTASTMAPNEDDPSIAPRTAETVEYDMQGVCEACGTLAHDLADRNGRLVCPDCRDA